MQQSQDEQSGLVASGIEPPLLSIKSALTELAYSLGFDLIGFTAPEVDEPSKNAFSQWLQNKYHAGMQYMEQTKEMRNDPSLLLQGVQTVIVVALSYARNLTSCTLLLDKNKRYGKIARYAQSRDYHRVFKGTMKRFMQQAQELFSRQSIQNAQIIAACDTKPILERYFAQKAGLGFIGKNSMLITKDFGSYVMLGCFLTTEYIEPDQPGQGTCGTCTRCLNACPTKAIVQPRIIDANKCISYWTIEHRGKFMEKTPQLAGNLFGCDICQEVCPYNKRALVQKENELNKRRVKEFLPAQEILAIPSKEAFAQRYAGTPLMRAGYEGMKRNALAVING